MLHFKKKVRSLHINGAFGAANNNLLEALKTEFKTKTLYAGLSMQIALE